MYKQIFDVTYFDSEDDRSYCDIWKYNVVIITQIKWFFCELHRISVPKVSDGQDTECVFRYLTMHEEISGFDVISVFVVFLNGNTWMWIGKFLGEIVRVLGYEV